MKIIKLLGITLFMLAITVALLELIGHFVVSKKWLILIQDVDHRMKPFSDKDINEDGIRFKGSSKDLQDKHVVFISG